MLFQISEKVFDKNTWFVMVLNSLRVAPSVQDERVYAIVAESLLPYISSVPNFRKVIYAKLFVKKFMQ